MPQYLGFNPGGGISGVFQSHTPSAPAVAYVYVPDVAATLTAIDAAGGRRTADPMSAPGMGTFGYFVDPSGTHVWLIGP
jgi:predicted enzyme related to lactoylglutathione lyase